MEMTRDELAEPLEAVLPPQAELTMAIIAIRTISPRDEAVTLQVSRRPDQSAGCASRPASGRNRRPAKVDLLDRKPKLEAIQCSVALA